MTARPRADASFLYLNREGRWDGFHMDGLDIGADGALRLRSLPKVGSPLPNGLRTAAIPGAPAGVAVGPEGSVYFTDPGDAGGAEQRAHRILRIDGCDGTHAAVPCLGGPGDRPTRLRHPRGLLFHPGWRQLLVADSGNQRIQRFHVDTWQLAGIWDQTDGIGEPWSLAADSLGDVYVVDHGRREVLKFDRTGIRRPGFWEAVAGRSPWPSDPVDVAIARSGPDSAVYVLDGARHSVFVFDTSGRFQREFGGDIIQQPMGLAATTDAVYVGDNARRRVLVFRPSGDFVGEASGYPGPTAALTMDRDGGLIVHPGSTLLPLRFSSTGAFSREGVAWAGPFSNPGRIPHEWHLVTADAQRPAGAHLQLFVYASSSGNPLPAQVSGPPWNGAAVELAASLADDALCDEHWLRFPGDASRGVVHALKRPPRSPSEDMLAASTPAKRLSWLWVGISLAGDGSASPSVAQMRLDFDHPTGLAHLPAIYGENRPSSQFVGRYLALLESAFTDVERRIDGLPARFDPEAVAVDLLPWLAGWLALDVTPEWTERELREAIAGAFESYGRRGTVDGLRAAVRLYTGVDVHIQEPLLNASWWSLVAEGATDLDVAASGLDFTTMLAPAQPQGAVLGTTAVMDASYLLEEDEFGTPLFSDIAHRFTALIYRGARFSEEKVSDVRAVIDREKPAHTLYDLCVIEPTLRIGYQARLGVDTVVAGPVQPTALAETSSAAGLVLGGELPGRLGEQSEVGHSTWLAAGSSTMRPPTAGQQ